MNITLLENFLVVKLIREYFRAITSVVGMLKKIITIAVLFLPLFLFAPPPGPGGDQGLPPCGPPFHFDPCIPIDGGISLLIAAGLAYGGKRAYDSHKKG